VNRHPGIEAALQHFEYSHLPEPLAQLSRHFSDLANLTVTMVQTDDPQLTLALQNLLTAKDCAVRAYRIDLQRRHGSAPDPKPGAAGQPIQNRWRPINAEGEVSSDPAPENPDDQDEGETGPPEMRL
jgi:hypothetical protein